MQIINVIRVHYAQKDCKLTLELPFPYGLDKSMTPFAVKQ